MVVNEQVSITLDEWMALSKHESFEILNGRRIEANVAAAGGTHQIVAGNVAFILQSYVRSRKIGVILPDQMAFLMHDDAPGLKNALIPDVSFVSNDNVPDAWDVDKPHPGAPTLAVEIISPGDDADVVQEKARMYLDGGTAQVWLVYPKTREVHQYSRTEPDHVRIYRQGKLSVEALFPDIEGLTVEAIFDLPAWAIKDLSSSDE